MLLVSYAAKADGDFNINTGTGTGLGNGMTFTDGTLTIVADGTYTINASGEQTTNRIVVSSDIRATITLNDVYIDQSAILDGACAFDMTGATVSIMLEGDNILKSLSGAGLQAPSGSTLVIDGSGSLTANGGGDSAGIGGGGGSTSGTITISGGNITATGGANGAGVGGGYCNGGSRITINGGNVTATGGGDAAGIGGGRYGSGVITINGGYITAFGGNGYSIGSGYNAGISTITIDGGCVIANNIGGPGVYTGGTLTMNGYAFVDASLVRDNSSKGGGILFNANTGTLYGNIVLTVNATIPTGKTLTIPSGKALIIAKGKTLTNNGTIKNNGTIDNCNGTLINNGTIEGADPTCEFTTLPTPSDEHILYVKQDGTGNGSSWENAYPNLADPLFVAKSNPDIHQIWVAEGRYIPRHKAGDGTQDQDKAFVLVEGVKIYGGFPADANDTEHTSISTRGHAPLLNATILSGDLDNNDGDNFTNNGENACHVIIGANISNVTVLDGFTVTGGNAATSGGITLNTVNRVVKVLSENGGGIYNETSSPLLTNITISGNMASYYGGGICNYSSSPTLTNVTVSGNTASTDGGGIFNSSSSTVLTNVTINRNTASHFGGGIYNVGSSLTLTNVTISGNTANSYYGGGIYNFYNSSLTLTNVTISGNTASTYGGGIYNDSPSLKLYNTIVWGNNTEIYIVGSAPEYYHSLVKGVTTEDENGNLDGSINPVFVLPATAPAPTTTGNYRLSACSSLIDAGDNDLYENETASGRDLSSDVDLDGNPRLFGRKHRLGRV